MNHQAHLYNAELILESMNADKIIAQNCNYGLIYVCSMDLEKSLPFPILTVSVVYYKRNINCYNLNVNNFATRLFLCMGQNNYFPRA